MLPRREASTPQARAWAAAALTGNPDAPLSCRVCPRASQPPLCKCVALCLAVSELPLRVLAAKGWDQLARLAIVAIKCAPRAMGVGLAAARRPCAAGVAGGVRAGCRLPRGLLRGLPEP